VRENLAALKNAQTCDQDNERSLLLACARTSLDTTCSERIRALVRQSLNWERLGHTAVDHGIFPLLYRALSRDVPDAIPRATLNIWQEIFSRNVAHNLYLVHALGDIMSLLEGARDPRNPLQGSAARNHGLWRFNSTLGRGPSSLGTSSRLRAYQICAV
jgi:hypothetical protein